MVANMKNMLETFSIENFLLYEKSPVCLDRQTKQSLEKSRLKRKKTLIDSSNFQIKSNLLEIGCKCEKYAKDLFGRKFYFLQKRSRA